MNEGCKGSCCKIKNECLRYTKFISSRGNVALIREECDDGRCLNFKGINMNTLNRDYQNADISKCINKECKVNSRCWRYISKPSEYQVYSLYGSINNYGCEARIEVN